MILITSLTFVVLMLVFIAAYYLCAWSDHVLRKMQAVYICDPNMQDLPYAHVLPWGVAGTWILSNLLFLGVPALIAELGMWMFRNRRADMMVLRIYAKSSLPNELKARVTQPRSFISVPAPVEEDTPSWLILPSRGSKWALTEPWREKADAEKKRAMTARMFP